MLSRRFCVGNIVGPLSFTAESAPNYIPAKVTIIVSSAAAIAFIVMLQAYYIFENRRRDKLEAAGEVVYESDIEFKDVTDRMNKEFRYRL